jgi:hypothetical protein
MDTTTRDRFAGLTSELSQQLTLSPNVGRSVHRGHDVQDRVHHMHDTITNQTGAVPYNIDAVVRQLQTDATLCHAATTVARADAADGLREEIVQLRPQMHYITSRLSHLPASSRNHVLGDTSAITNDADSDSDFEV